MAQTNFDLIVVGAGTAGLPAAICAARRGLKVALVEAADAVGGTLFLSSASISAAGTSIQERAGIEDSPDKHFADAMRINHGTGQLPLIRRWVDEAAETIEWLLSMGWTCTPDEPAFAPEHDLYTTPRTYRSTGQGIGVLAALTGPLKKLEAEGAITTFLNTRVRGLIAKDGRVTGVTAVREGQTVTLHGKTVALTTGGYTASERFWRELHGVLPLRYYRDYSRGDHLDMGAALGAKVKWAHYGMPAFGATRDLGSPAAGWIHSVILPSVREPWEIYVNAEGERFMPEDEPSIDRRERYVTAQKDWFFWCIYDEAIRKASPPLFRFDEERLAELFDEGEDWICAPTLDELARRCGLNPNTLANTVDDYNRAVAVGSDQLRRQHLPAPIGTGPFYAVKHYGVSITSAAGLEVDNDLAVLGEGGKPIAGLYAAGESLGYGFLGHSFLSGSIVSAAITFGRLIGEKVAA